MKKRINLAMCTLFFLGVTLFSTPVIAEPADAFVVNGEESSIEPRTDIKEWLFKVENGNLYKRLYNYTRNRWETDWIFVMSGVEEL